MLSTNTSIKALVMKAAPLQVNYFKVKEKAKVAHYAFAEL